MKKHAQCLSYGTYDLDSSFLFTAMNKEDPRYHSLNVQFSTMSFNPQTATLDGDDREKILKKQIIPYFRHLRDHEMYRNNPEHQKQQFMISYVEIMGKLAEKTVPALKQSEAEYERLKKTDYLKHLKLFEEFGFDMSYHSMMRKVRGETFHDDAEEVYEKFVRSSTGITGLDRIRERVQKNVSDHTFTAGNDDEYRVAA